MMFWDKIWEFLKSFWHKIRNRTTSLKSNSTLDTVSLKVFGLDIKVTREVPVGVPYELTVVIPRAEIRGDKSSDKREIILSSITIAHSPRFEGTPEKAGTFQKPIIPAKTSSPGEMKEQKTAA